MWRNGKQAQVEQEDMDSLTSISFYFHYPWQLQSLISFDIIIIISRVNEEEQDKQFLKKTLFFIHFQTTNNIAAAQLKEFCGRCNESKASLE